MSDSGPLNELPELSEAPADAQGDWGASNADTLVYRLALSCEPVPGLPEELSVGDTLISFIRGPLRAQETQIRQQFGLPVVFDKVMRRAPVGDGEVITLVTISTDPPTDLETGFAEWRAQALAAAGMLAAILDERVAGVELFEDAVLYRKGSFVGAADMRGKVRTYLPFEVNESDQNALDLLATLSASESSPVARAARLYRRAALEGPTADAYAMLWVAAECFSEKRSPSKKDIEKALGEAGIDPAGFPISVGHLIDLRGKIQHHGVESDDRLATAFYEMEAVVRTLIRQSAGIVGGWWPAADNPAGFSDPFDAAVAGAQGQRTSAWHPSRLPPIEDPQPLRIPRRSPNPSDDPRLEVDAALGDATQALSSCVLDAIEWFDPTLHLTIRATPPPHISRDAPFWADDQEIWIALEPLKSDQDPAAIVNFFWDLVSLVGFASAQAHGVESKGDGVALVQAFGAWFQYTRLVTYGEYEADLVAIPTGIDHVSLGKICGWAAAGDARAIAAIDGLDGTSRKLADGIVEVLSQMRPVAPVHLLAK